MTRAAATSAADLPAPVSRLRQARGEVGDIIFVYSSNAGSWVTRQGQVLIRWLLSGRLKPARFSHVAMVSEPGVAIHAAPGAVRKERLDQIMPTSLTSHVRVVRRSDLSEAEKDTLAAAAKYYFDQRYAFFYGRHSLGFGLVAQAIGYTKRKLTQPFCSQLVAVAYSQIGKPAGHLPPDQMLPLDLEHACVGPQWQVVTGDYYSTPLSAEARAILGALGPDFEKSVLGVIGDTSEPEDVGADIVAATAKFEHDAASFADWLVRIRLMLAAFSFQTAIYCGAHPNILLAELGGVLLDDLEKLDEYYSHLEASSGSPGGTIAPELRKVFSNYREDQAPYEGMLTFAELSNKDQQAEALEFAARTIRLQTLFLAMVVGLGLSKSEEPKWKDLSQESILPFLVEMPILTEDRAENLKALATSFSSVVGHALLANAVRNVVSFHQKLSDLRRQVDAETGLGDEPPGQAATA